MIYLRPHKKLYNFDNNHYNNLINDKFSLSLLNNFYTIIDLSDNINLYDINNNLDQDEIIEENIDKIINIRYMYIIDEEIINIIKMLLLENKLKKKYIKHLVKNHFIFLKSNDNIDQYIKITNEDNDIDLSLIRHYNFTKLLDETKLYINDDEIALQILKLLGHNNITYFEYYITKYKYNTEDKSSDINLELYILPGIDNLIIISGNKSKCDELLNLLHLNKEKSLDGDIRDIYLKINIDPYKIKDFSFKNINIIKKIKDSLYIINK